MLGLRIAVSATGLALLLSRVHIASLVPRWEGGTVLWLIGALLVTLLGVVLSTLRWQRVLEALERPERLPLLLAYQLAGLFVGNVLPSTVGGDVLRVVRLSGRNGESTTSFASVALERLSGWIVLPLMTLVGLALDPSLLHLGAASRVAVIIAAVTLALLVLVVYAAGHPGVGGRLAHNTGWLRFIGAVHLGVDRFRRHRRAAASVLVAGFAYQLAVVAAAWMGAQALDLRVSWLAMLAFFPCVAIVQVLPISIGGLGLREGALVLFLGRLHVSHAQAIALGLLVYAFNLLVSLLGAPAFAAGGRPSPERVDRVLA